MSIAVTHHRFSDPLAAAAAVIVVLGAASVLGVAMSADESAAPTAPAQTRVDKPPSARIGGLEKGSAAQPFRPGLGDFSRPQSGDQGVSTLKGGHSTIGLP